MADERIVDSRIRLVRNDTGPQLQLVLTDSQTGSVVDLTGASGVLHFRAVGSTTVLFSRPLTIPVGTAGNGIALVDWQASDLDQDAGDYEGEIEITFSDGVIQTAYDTLQFRIREDFT